jgi:hypothetical protein
MGNEQVAIRRILTINPTYATVMYRNVSSGSKLLEYKEDIKVEKRSKAQREAEKNLLKNNHLGDLSIKAFKRIQKSINWLEYISEEKYTAKGVGYKVSMITLTIPSFSKEIEEKRLKKVLNQFLTYARSSYHLCSYVWKAELTKSGNLHYHLLTSEILGYRDVQDKWNDLLRKEGLLDSYVARFSKMTLDEYRKLRQFQCDQYGTIYNDADVTRAYLFGIRSKWLSPRSVQIDQIPSSDSLAGYLSKYISKSTKYEGGVNSDSDILKGRIWGCSRNLSMSNKLSFKIEQDDTKYIKMLHDLTCVSHSYDDIIFKDEKGVERVVGYKLFYDIDVWSGRLEKSSLQIEFDDFIAKMKRGWMYVNPQLEVQTQVNDVISSKLKDSPAGVIKRSKPNIQHILF